MSRFVLLCTAVVFIVSNVTAQRNPKLPIRNNAAKGLLPMDWSKHEANAFKKKGNGSRDSIVFDFNYKVGPRKLVAIGLSSPISSKIKAVEMPNIKPSGNCPMIIYPVDTSATYAARIYKD